MAGRLFLILWLCLAVPVGAGAAEETRQRGIDPAVLTDGFLGAHPDLRWRNAGIQAYREKDYEMALVYFRRAARYADKPSQAMIAEMYWEGRGVPQDRPIAYAWMDIAAERLYPDLVAFRERYWDALSEAERAVALERGQEILAQYGDEVAKPRLEAVLRRARREVTGSRLGSVGLLEIIPFTGPLAGTGMTLRGEEYYAPRYWEPAEYWRMHDEIWRAPRRGTVEIGDLEKVDRGAPPREDE